MSDVGCNTWSPLGSSFQYKRIFSSYNKVLGKFIHWVLCSHMLQRCPLLSVYAFFPFGRKSKSADVDSLHLIEGYVIIAKVIYTACSRLALLWLASDMIFECWLFHVLTACSRDNLFYLSMLSSFLSEENPRAQMLIHCISLKDMLLYHCCTLEVIYAACSRLALWCLASNMIFECWLVHHASSCVHSMSLVRGKVCHSFLAPLLLLLIFTF